MTLLVVDGSNALYRAHYAVPPMVHKESGVPVNAIIGFMRILKSNLCAVDPSRAVVVFDRGGKNHRHLIYPEYKAPRQKDAAIEAALAKQIPIIRDLVRALGIRVIGKRCVEADDIIGSLAKQYKRMSYILSGDKDFAQLLSETVRVINPNKKITLTTDNVEEVYGFPANQIIDFLMLDGDKIDNIPGVPGVGPTIAKKLLTEYCKAESIPCEAFPKKARENFTAIKNQLKLSRKLVKIKTDLDFDVDRTLIGKPDYPAVREICKAYGLRSLSDELTRDWRS